jgi:molybdopterin-containing oxidoreductase family membrane subunit
VVIGIGFLCWLTQISEGLGITGMSRDVTWGFYIAQFTFLVGVAASAVMVVLPYYLHDYKQFGKLTILGEFFAVGAVLMCLLFIMADLGQPQRGMNMFLHPSPRSILFWDAVVLNGYLFINLILSWSALNAERSGTKPSGWWVKPLIYLSIPWAVSIHTVTAFIYCGLPGRSFWLTAILAPRFLASAFASGPAILILLCFIMRKFTRFDVGREPVQKLALIATYAMVLNVFFMLLEVFTAIYSGIPEHAHHFQYLFLGLEGKSMLVPWMWIAQIFAVLAIILLVVPKYRKNENLLRWACISVFLAIWIDKGLGMVVTGFVPSPLGAVTEYWPTGREFMISLGIYAAGILLITVLYKVALTVRRQVV